MKVNLIYNLFLIFVILILHATQRGEEGGCREWSTSTTSQLEQRKTNEMEAKCMDGKDTYKINSTVFLLNKLEK